MVHNPNNKNYGVSLITFMKKRDNAPFLATLSCLFGHVEISALMHPKMVHYRNTLGYSLHNAKRALYNAPPP